MRKEQRYRYEMFVRVRDFGTANAELFPSSSKGGRMFTEVSAAVTAIEESLTKRDLARAEARRVKPGTRAVVTSYMKVIAATARQIALDEPGPNPFRRGGSKSNAALLAKARLFIDEAKVREATFVEFGLPVTFISDFTTLVDELAVAVTVRNNGRAWRQRAQVGIESALTTGAEAIHNLDVLVPNALRLDPVRTGFWHGARRIEGLVHKASTPHAPKVDTPAAAPAPAAEPAKPVAILNQAS